MIDRPDTPHADVLLEGIWEDEVTPDDLASRALSAAQASSYAFRVASEGTTATAQLGEVDVSEFLESETGKWAQGFIGIVRVGESLVHVSHALGELARSLQQVNLEQSEIVYQVEADIEAAQRQSAVAGIDPAERIAELIAIARARASEVADKMPTPEQSTTKKKPAVGLVSGFMAFGRVPGTSTESVERNGRVARNGHARNGEARNGYAVRDARAGQNGHTERNGHAESAETPPINGHAAAETSRINGTNGHDATVDEAPMTAAVAAVEQEAVVTVEEDAAAAAQDAFANSGDETTMVYGFMAFGRTPSTTVHQEPSAAEPAESAEAEEFDAPPVSDPASPEAADATDADGDAPDSEVAALADDEPDADVRDEAPVSELAAPASVNGFIDLGRVPTVGALPSADGAVVPQPLMNGFLAFGRTPAVNGNATASVPAEPSAASSGPIPIMPQAQFVPIPAPSPVVDEVAGQTVAETASMLPLADEAGSVPVPAVDDDFLSFGRVPSAGAWPGAGAVPTVPSSRDPEVTAAAGAAVEIEAEAVEMDVEPPQDVDDARDLGEDAADRSVDADDVTADVEPEADDEPVAAETEVDEETDAADVVDGSVDADDVTAAVEPEVGGESVTEIEDSEGDGEPDEGESADPVEGPAEADDEIADVAEIDDEPEVAEVEADEVEPVAAEAEVDDETDVAEVVDESVEADDDIADDLPEADDEPDAAQAEVDDEPGPDDEPVADSDDAADEDGPVDDAAGASDTDVDSAEDDQAEAGDVAPAAEPDVAPEPDPEAVRPQRPVRQTVKAVKFSDLMKAAGRSPVAAEPVPFAVAAAADRLAAPEPQAEPEEPAAPKAPPVLATGPAILGRTEPLVLKKRSSPAVQQVHDAVASILGSLRGSPHGPGSGFHWAAGLLENDTETIMVVTTSDAGWLPPGVVIPAGARVVWNMPTGYRWASIDDPVRQLMEYATFEDYSLTAVATTHPSRAYSEVLGVENVVGVDRPGKLLAGGRGRLEATVSPARLQHIRSLNSEEAGRQARALVRDLESVAIAPEHAIGIEAARLDARCFLEAKGEVPPPVLDQLHRDEQALSDVLRLDRTPASAEDLFRSAPDARRLRDRMVERAIVVATLAAAYGDVDSALYAWTFARFLAGQDQDSTQAR
ncbi:hypothetical protein [Tsukamurella pseudospumae]|uniref:DUF5632 domain-containing protein n=1 Tax=Tsukamurella pseudospumae TaxID=239498 RepID=A0A137ZYA3_9ACTN|nr:hypothetical protein [Tsukamurella pseudospumae]KXP03176.1 hypothetical protein AXK60_15065 [Tsukamurella pseudospumae]